MYNEKLSAPLLHAMCDRFAADPDITRACRGNGIAVISNRTFWSYRAASRKHADEVFHFEWMGAKRWFHEHINVARDIAISELSAKVESVALHGYDEVLTFGGQIQYQRNPQYLDWTDEDFKEFGVDPINKYLLDPETGLPKVATVRKQAGVQLMLSVLAAHRPALYGHKQTIEVSNKTAGVHVVRHQHQMLPKPAPLMPIEVIPMPAIENRAASPADLAQIMGEPVIDGEMTEVEPEKPTLSEHQRALLDRFKSSIPANATKRPTGRVNIGNGGSSANDPPENVA